MFGSHQREPKGHAKPDNGAGSQKTRLQKWMFAMSRDGLPCPEDAAKPINSQLGVVFGGRARLTHAFR